MFYYWFIFKLTTQQLVSGSKIFTGFYYLWFWILTKEIYFLYIRKLGLISQAKRSILLIFSSNFDKLKETWSHANKIFGLSV